MKANERHHLKQNDFATTAVRLIDAAHANRNRILMGAAAAVGVIVVIAGIMMWRGQSRNQAGAMLGAAMAIANSPVVPASSLPGAKQQPGTYPTDQARAEAAIKAFDEIAAAYPNTSEGLAAAYQSAAEKMALGKAAEAEAAFAAVAAKAGSGLYGPVARLGQAQAMLAAGKASDAVAIYTELAAARETTLPVDGVLMELGQAQAKAGKTAEARAAYKRVVDEFPDSMFAADARQKLAAIN
ncbi:MAG: tetratricopeptide repeat protein [Acidobacteria bacterium]|nr:tetratricopeptide repeat protein [Acidobacteriota bacterium]